MKMTLPGILCVLLGAAELVWTFYFRAAPEPGTAFLTLIGAATIGVGLYLIAAANGTARPEPKAPAIPDLSNDLRAEREKAGRLESEIASLSHKLQELDTLHKDALERRSSLQTALLAAEAKAKAHATTASTSAPAEQVNAAIVNFLGLLQRKGRLVDFVMDDITKYNDAQVGAAARVVHQGVSSVVREYFDIEPVRKDNEGVSVTLDKDYNPLQYQLVGRVSGNPPFRGTLIHRGWRTKRVTLPRLAAAQPGPASHEIIAPAEVELT